MKNNETKIEKKASAPKFLRRRVLIPISVCAVLLFFFSATLAYSRFADRALEREIAAQERDPVTGVIPGTEAVTIVPSANPPPRAAVLFIHGFLAARSDFADMGERIAKHGLVARMMRLPGHGTTPSDFAALPDGALYQAVHREYLELRDQYERVYVAGFSMGGSLATLLAAEEKVDRLALVAPYYGVTYKWYYVLPPETWNGMIGWAAPYIARPKGTDKINDTSAVGKYFNYRTLPTAGVRQLVRLGKQARRPEILRKIACPTLVLHARGDGAASPKRAFRAFEQISSARKEFVWLDQSDHVLFWDFDKETVKDRVEEFLLAP